MTDMWADTEACMPIGLNADGHGPAIGEEAVETVCWVCLTPWPCARSTGYTIPDLWDHFAFTAVDETLCWRCMTPWPCPVSGEARDAQ